MRGPPQWLTTLPEPTRPGTPPVSSYFLTTQWNDNTEPQPIVADAGSHFTHSTTLRRHHYELTNPTAAIHTVTHGNWQGALDSFSRRHSVHPSSYRASYFVPCSGFRTAHYCSQIRGHFCSDASGNGQPSDTHFAHEPRSHIPTPPIGAASAPSTSAAILSPWILPFSTSALNSLLETLGQWSQILKMVYFFETPTNPLPVPTKSDNTSDDDDNFSLTQQEWKQHSAEPNTNPFNILLTFQSLVVNNLPHCVRPCLRPGFSLPRCDALAKGDTVRGICEYREFMKSSTRSPTPVGGGLVCDETGEASKRYAPAFDE